MALFPASMPECCPIRLTVPSGVRDGMIRVVSGGLLFRGAGALRHPRAVGGAAEAAPFHSSTAAFHSSELRGLLVAVVFFVVPFVFFAVPAAAPVVVVAAPFAGAPAAELRAVNPAVFGILE